MKITLYLLREGIDLNNVDLNKPERYQEPSLIPPSEAGVSWRMFVHQRPPAPVPWLRFVQPLLAEKSADTAAFGQSAGAVLLISAHSRVFAVTFGTGRHAIRDGDIESDFGLKVVANSVDPFKLTRAEARGLDKGTRNSVSSLPVPNAIFALNLAINEEWIRRFAGQMQDKSFAVSANGADSLQLNLKDFGLVDLPEKLGKALELFTSKRYQSQFPFLDYFRRLPPKAPEVAVLDIDIANELDARSSELGFAAPREFQMYDPDFFIFRAGRRETVVPELTADNVYAALDELDAWQNPMFRVKVDAKSTGGDYLDENTNLRQYVVANRRLDHPRYGGNYSLTAGAWFKVDDDYSQRLDRFMENSVVDISDELKLPEWDDSDLISRKVKGKYGEERYNNYVGQTNGWAVLDRNFYRGAAGEQVEICDLLTPAKQLICVKRMDGADAMSHLFQQGSVSAALMFNDQYRAKILNYLDGIGGGSDFADAQAWTFVFGIATSKPGSLRETMTFFSKVALMTHHAGIHARGFKIAIARIQRTG